MDDRPLPNAEVRFYPMGGKDLPFSIGVTDDQGNYSLKLSETDRDGALVGEHRVIITVNERNREQPMGPEGPRELVPRKYNRESTLTCTVPREGRKDFNLELKSH
jgi:hypothetical protein